MISFQINDMTCGHCVSSITQAVKAVDGDASVQINLAAHRVDIDTARSDGAELREAITAAGYTPVCISESTGTPIEQAASTRKGCCSG